MPWQPSLSKCTSAFLAFADAAKNKSAEEWCAMISDSVFFLYFTYPVCAVFLISISDVAHNNLVKQLRFYEFEVNKAQITKDTCSRELKQYDELDTEIGVQYLQMGL